MAGSIQPRVWLIQFCVALTTNSPDARPELNPDGPYEETPVEREGQADLERFFDDHLGASDRDGMDKENLPTNLIASVSESPRLDGLGARVLRVAPTVSIRNPTVRA